MHIVIVGEQFTFPEGTAATSRVFAYAKGIKAYGNSVEVISLTNEYNNGEGNFEGIPYYYPLNQKRRNPSFIVRNFYKIKKYINHYHLLVRLNRKKPIDVIILYSDSILILLLQYRFKLMSGGLLIKELNEIFFANNANKGISQIYRQIFSFFTFQCCDGIIAISEYLNDLAIQQGDSKEQVILMPALVDFELFNGNFHGESPIRSNYILQSGTLNCKRDRIDILIRAMGLIHSHFPDLKLVLTGQFFPKEHKQLIFKLIRDLGLDDKVIIREYIPRSELPSYFSNAVALIATRTGQLEETKASFPTKLPEYLASGKPVVVSAVGEIPKYLEDNVSAFLVPPDDSIVLAEKLQFVLDHPDFAKQVGRKGKQVAQLHFDNKSNCKRFIEFVNKLKTVDHN